MEQVENLANIHRTCLQYACAFHNLNFCTIVRCQILAQMSSFKFGSTSSTKKIQK